MKKSALVFFAALLVALLSSFGIALAEEGTFSLPASLQVVEDEAFAGTAVQKAVFQDGLASLGDGAFADASDLTDVYLPPSVEFIGEGALPPRSGLTVHGEKKSYAETWAGKHDIHFEADYRSSLLAESGRGQAIRKMPIDWDSRADNSLPHGEGVRAHAESRSSMRPQDRPELHPIDYRFP